MAEVLFTNGDKQIIPCPSLEEMQKIVGGYVERLSLADERAMYLNEDGKALNLPRNEMATFLGDLAGIAADDFIVGNVVILSKEEESSQ